MKKSTLITLSLFLVFTNAVPVSADSANNSEESSNYDKADKLLPGEEVVTPTGKKMKVWTTEGPVPVSKAPEPYEDERDINGVPVIIDRSDRKHHRHRSERRPVRESSDSPQN